MYTLSLKDGGAFLGTIDDRDLSLLIDQLEEEHELSLSKVLSMPSIKPSVPGD